MGVSQHHRKRLGGWVNCEQPLLQLTQQRPISPPHSTDTGSVEGIEVSIAQQGNQGWIRDGWTGCGRACCCSASQGQARQRNAKNWEQSVPGGEWRWYSRHV